MSQNLFVGVGGHVVALDPVTGSELWRTKLKGSDTVTVAYTERSILAATGGELFYLDPGSGQIRWRNRLKGLGTGIVTFGSPGDAAAAADLATRAAAAAVAT